MKKSDVNFNIRIACGLLILCSTALLAFAIDRKIKVHKHNIAISPPNSKGIVQIEGRAGSIETSSPAKVEIHITRKSEQVAVAADGSFTTHIQAQPGDKIKVQATNEQKKKSYGTLNIPQSNPLTVKKETKTSKVVPAIKQTLIDTKPIIALDENVIIDKKKETPVIVYINVVNPNTGQLLGNQQIQTSLTKGGKLSYQKQIEKMLEKSASGFQTTTEKETPIPISIN